MPITSPSVQNPPVPHKALLEPHLTSVLRRVHAKGCPDPEAALLAVLNLHKQPALAAREAVVFAPRTPDEREIKTTAEGVEFIMQELVGKFRVEDPDFIKRHIRHQRSQYLPDSHKADLGKYFTPEHLVSAVQSLLAPVLAAHPGARIADLAAGCGAFLAPFDGHRVIGRDVDEKAVLLLKEMGFSNVGVANSLQGVSREKLGLDSNETLVLVGNPPYNDTTSQNKRRLAGQGGVPGEIDADIRSKDLGISFLRAFAKLRPAAICVLHPLSYLSKPANFRALKGFSDSYRLTGGFIFSSAEFGANIGAKTPFAVVAALYEPGTMTHEDIKAFAFPVFRTMDGKFADSGDRLVLNTICTVDGSIRKYPPTRGMATESDIGLYNYNIRDANSLITSGAMTATTSGSHIPVQFDELWKYAYLNCFKRYFGTDFVFGNLSPIMRPQDLQAQWFRDACVLDTIMNHPRLAPTQRGAPGSFVLTRAVLSDAKRSAASFSKPGMPNFYQAFVDYWETGDSCQKVLKPWFELYFKRIRAEALLASSAPISVNLGTCQD